MIKKISILVLLVLVFVSLGAVSALDDANQTVSNSDENIVGSQEVNLTDEVVSSTSEDVLSGSITVNKDNYATYFDNKGNALSTINSGDTVNLDGSFSNCNFIFNKTVTVEGGSSNMLTGCTVKLLSGASGSTILKLNIKNTEDFSYGICLDGADNCIVKNCFVNNTGQSSYSVALGNAANNNQIIYNSLHAYGITYGHGTRSTPPFVMFGSEHNYIAHNVLSCDDANGIYLSHYGAGIFRGGESNYNTIYNNTVTYNVGPTSWSYGIQVMGSNNTIELNTVTGSYRGISTSTDYYGGNRIINNRVVNLRGYDYQTGKTSGGENGITGTYNSYIEGNRIENSMIMGSGSGITALDNSIVKNNYVEVVDSKGKGINAYGSNVQVLNNDIFTVSGAGIFQQSGATNLLADGNTIKSQTGIGILIKKVSNREMPSAVKIKNNIVSTSAQYIIDAADVQIDSDWLIESNVGGMVLDPSGSYNADRPIYKYSDNVLKITPSNYDSYFDDNGNFKSGAVKDLDILSFEGTFKNKDIKINSPVKLTGKNPVFYNSTIQVTSGGVWIENLTIINQNFKINGWGILVNRVVDGVAIINNAISVNDLKAAYAIYIVESSYVDVINNTLYSSGDFLTYTLLSYSASDCRFINNTLTTSGTGEAYGDTNEYCLDGEWTCIDGEWYCLDGQASSESCLDGSHVIQEIQRTYGILMIYSTGNDVSGNKVNVSSKLNRTINNIGVNQSTNTIIGIDLYYSSHDNIFSYNEVTVKGRDNYIYGMGVLGYYTGMNAPAGQGANGNEFISNNIIIEGTYFATGIIIGDESQNTLVKNNTINVKAINVTYGITLEMSHKSAVESNNITLNSNIIYGLEAEISNGNNISGNNFKLNSSKVYGIAFKDSKNNVVSLNKVTASDNGEELFSRELDAIRGPDTGVYLSGESTGNRILSNNITTDKGYAINLASQAKNNVIQDNYLVSELGTANRAVNNSLDNDVSGNYIYLVEGVLSSCEVQYLEYGNYTFAVSEDLADKLEGAKVDFYVSDEYIGTAYVTDSKAVLHCCLDEFTPTSYIIRAVVSKEDYKVTGFDSVLNVGLGNLFVEVTNISVKDGLNGKFIAKITNTLGKPVSNLNVIFYRQSQPIGSAVTDSNGVASKVTLVPKTLSGTFDIKAEVSDSTYEYYLPSQGIGKLTILDIAPVNSQIDNTVSFGGKVLILTDNNGFAIDNKKVSVKIGTASYTLKTTANGEVFLPNVNVGSYAFSISFNGDSVYENVNYNGRLSVLAPLSGNSNFNVYYGTTVQYKVRVIGSDGNYVGAGINVVIKVNGKSYNVKTDKNGYAIKSVKMGVGKYTVSAHYNGYAVSNKIVVKSILTAKNIVKKKAKKIKFSAKLVNKNGKALKNKKITFKIKNKKYKVKTNKKGIAILTLKKLKVGKYTITSSYGGCTIKNIIKIKK